MPRIVNYELSEAQDRFLYSTRPFPALIGGVGSGKSFIGGFRAFMRAKAGKGKGMIVAPTYPMLKDSTLPAFLKFARPYIRHWNKGDRVITLKNGHEILYRSAVDPDTLRGPSVNWAWLDEAAYMTSYTWPVILGRLREAVTCGDGSLLEPTGFVTCTPKGMNWLYEEWISKGKDDPDYELVNTSTMDNAANLRKQYIESLLKNYSGKYLAQEVYGQFVAFEGLIYDMFVENLHVWNPTKHGPVPTGKDVELYEYGLDTNYSQPCAITVHCIPRMKSYQKRRYDIQVDEVYLERMSTKKIVETFKEFYKTYGRGTIYADPSSQRLIDDLNSEGLNVVPADNTVNEGIRLEQEALTPINGEPGAYVTANCIHTRAEFACYSWAKKGRGPNAIFIDKPDKTKGKDHLMDSRRYRRISGSMAGGTHDVAVAEAAWA